MKNHRKIVSLRAEICKEVVTRLFLSNSKKNPRTLDARKKRIRSVIDDVCIEREYNKPQIIAMIIGECPKLEKYE